MGTKSEKTGVRKRSKPAMKAHLLALVSEMPHCWNPLHAHRYVQEEGVEGRGGVVVRRSHAHRGQAYARKGGEGIWERR